MANWHTDTINSTFNVNESVDSMVSARSENRSGFDSRASFTVGDKNASGRNVVSFSQNLAPSIVGINANQIPAVIDAIDTYISRINNYVNNLNPTADAHVAFKSEEVIRSLNTYMNNVKTYVMNLVSTLRAFQDKLIDVKTQWESYAGNLSNTIEETTGDNFAMGSQYERTFQNPGGASTSGTSVGASVSTPGERRTATSTEEIVK